MPRAFGDFVRIAELHRVRRIVIRPMPHGLSVRAERRHRLRVDAVFFQQRQRSVGEATRDLDIERSEFVERDAPVALREIEDAPPQ